MRAVAAGDARVVENVFGEQSPLLLKEGWQRDQEMSRSVRTRADGVVGFK